MDIDFFQEGDIITRVAPSGNRSSSFIGDKLEFVGIESKLIILIWENSHNNSHIIIHLELDIWKDGWEFYPRITMAKAERRLRELEKLQPKHPRKKNDEAKDEAKSEGVSLRL